MPKKISSLETNLLKAQKERLIVQFARTFEQGTFVGYVLGVGPEFFMLASLNDGFQFENYVCLRMKDVQRLNCPAKYAPFYLAVRKIRGDKMPRNLKLDLTNAATILKSAAPSLVTIHRETRDPNVCKIGFALSSNKTTLEMIEIDPNAQWETDPTYLRFKHITRIDLPGPYERALLSVGGYPEVFRKKRP
jgi:hypothetical protein